MDVPLYTTVFTYNMNLDKYNSLSPAQKKVIDDHCTPEWASKVTDPWTDFEANGRVKMKALPDHEVYPLTPEQLARMEAGREAAARQLGRGGEEGRRRRRRHRRRSAGDVEEIRGWDFDRFLPSPRRACGREVGSPSGDPGEGYRLINWYEIRG